MCARTLLATLTLTAGLCVALPARAFQAAGEPAVVPAQTLSTIERALRRADVPALARLYQESPNPAERVLAATALERIHFNLDKATDDARICERSLFDRQPQVAFFCARLANGNQRLAGGAQQADAAELEMTKRYARALPRGAMEHLRGYAAAQMAHAPLQVQKPATGFSIALERSASNGHLPTLEAQANGHTTRLIVDTGSGYLTLDDDTARELGVHLLDRSDLTRGLLSTDIPAKYGVLDKLTFAGVTMTNAPVMVVPGRKRLIGIDLLRRLGTFRIAADQLTVYGDADSRPACEEPMLVASDVWGNHVRIVVALPIEGVLQTTLLDSGSSFFLSADQTVMDALHSGHNTRVDVRDMGPRRHQARINKATAEVVISGQPFQVTFDIFKDATLPWSYVLGSGALEYMDFYLDFENRHTCLLLHADRH
jgi:predicted aspartyl protease